MGLTEPSFLERMELNEFIGSKIVTNYDILVSKTPEELALYIHNAEAQAADTGRADTVESWLNWLKSPADKEKGI